MLFQEKILITLKNDIGFAGTYAIVSDYICIKQSDKSNVRILVALKSIKNAINLKGEDVGFEKKDKHIDFILLNSNERIIKLNCEITYAGVDAQCDNNEVKELLDDAELLCVNTELMIFVIIPKSEILKEWKY